MPTGVYIRTKEHIKNISGKNNPNYGKGLFGKDNGMYDVHRYGKDNPMYGKTRPDLVINNKLRNLSGEKNPMYGKHHSEETKQKQKQTRLGKFPWNKGLHPECAQGKNNPNYGKHPEPWNKGLTSEVDDRILVGKDNGNWNGGISFLPYCSKFNKKLKESIRQRDNHTCQLCNKIEEFKGKKLSIHHIHYDKENCNPDLISLCCRCNSKVNGNREQYEIIFMNKLNERELLFWTGS